MRLRLGPFYGEAEKWPERHLKHFHGLCKTRMPHPGRILAFAARVGPLDAILAGKLKMFYRAISGRGRRTLARSRKSLMRSASARCMATRRM